MAKKRRISRRGHGESLISGHEVIRLVSDAIAFSRISRLAVEELEKSGADQTNYHKPIHGDRGWPTGIVWESLQTVSHFNLAISLELTLKALIRLENPREERDTHKLSILHDRLTPSTRNRLESAWTMIDKSTPIEIVAFVSTSTSKPPHKPENNRLNSLRDWFDYFDTDLQMYTKRYIWENLAKEKYRHYIKDLSIFHSVFEILRVLVFDRARDVGVLLPERQADVWKHSPNFLTVSSISDLNSFYKNSGWCKDSGGRWTKQRLDGNRVLVHCPDLFWRPLISEGENYLTVENPRILGSTKKPGSERYTDPVLVAELITGSEK